MPKPKQKSGSERFNEDQICRNDLPRDVFVLLHDLCYHHDGRDVWNYVERAQNILRSTGEKQCPPSR